MQPSTSRCSGAKFNNTQYLHLNNLRCSSHDSSVVPCSISGWACHAGQVTPLLLASIPFRQLTNSLRTLWFKIFLSAKLKERPSPSVVQACCVVLQNELWFPWPTPSWPASAAHVRRVKWEHCCGGTVSEGLSCRCQQYTPLLSGLNSRCSFYLSLHGLF